MEVINKIPSQKILSKGFKKFKYNILNIALTMLLFPFVIFYSKKYIKVFLSFCFEYQRSGTVLINDQLINFNSFDYYYQDCVTKNLVDCSCYVDFDKENYQEIIIKNNQNQEISCLTVVHKDHSRKWVIGLHGWTENKYLALRLVSWFYSQGYNVLTFDSVAHGQTYGQYSDIGFSTAKDLLSIIKWLKTNYQVDSLGLIGNSMGASTAYYYSLNYSSQENINWVIADSGFANLLVQYRFVMQYRYCKPWWLISFGLSKAYWKFTNSKIKDYNLLAKQKSQVPSLLIHGQKDTFVPFFMSQEILQKHGNKNFDYLFLDDINHIETLSKSHQQYITKISKFVSKYEN